MDMKRHRYIYMGLYNSKRVFYSEAKEELYVGKNTYNGSFGQASIFAIVSIILYVIGRGIVLKSLNFPIMLYVIISAIIGVVLAIICSKRVDNANEEFFSNCEPFLVSDKSDWEKLLKQARNVTVGYIYLRVILLFLVVFEPILIQKVNDPILFITYFIIWFAFTYMLIQFNLSKRIRVVSKLKKDIKE